MLDRLRGRECRALNLRAGFRKYVFEALPSCHIGQPNHNDLGTHENPPELSLIES